MSCSRCGWLVLAGSPSCPNCGLALGSAPSGPVDLVLTRLDGDDAGHEWLIKHDPATIGRNPAAEVLLPVAAVSRAHCVLRRTPGGFSIEDASSQNGTMVNARRILGAQPLQAGDVIGVGSVELEVSYVPREVPLVEENGRENTSGTMFVGVSQVLAASPATSVELDEPTVAVAPAPSPLDDFESEPESEWKPEEAPASTDSSDSALTTMVRAATTFSTSFQPVYEALLAFHQTYQVVGGQEALDAMLREAEAVAENPDAMTNLMTLGQQAGTIAALLRAMGQLGTILEET